MTSEAKIGIIKAIVLHSTESRVALEHPVAPIGVLEDVRLAQVKLWFVGARSRLATLAGCTIAHGIRVLSRKGPHVFVAQRVDDRPLRATEQKHAQTVTQLEALGESDRVIIVRVAHHGQKFQRRLDLKIACRVLSQHKHRAILAKEGEQFGLIRGILALIVQELHAEESVCF